MQDLITHCLHYLPNQRPSAQEVFDRLCVPEFICLKRAVSMARDCNVETIAVRVSGQYESKKPSTKVLVKVKVVPYLYLCTTFVLPFVLPFTIPLKYIEVLLHYP